MHRALTFLLFCLLATGSGCAICSSCDDHSYGTYGGRWQRADMSYGRVGSAFTDVGFDATDADPTPAEPEEFDWDAEVGDEVAGGDQQSVLR